MPKQGLILKSAFLAKSALLAHVKPGLGAFLKSDIVLLAESERPKIGDSLNLDVATKLQFPDANRWDYVFSVPGTSRILALEPHSAKDSEISVVIKKKQHALAYLRDHFAAQHRVSKWLWVSHGTVSFSKMDRARRILDQSGIQFVGRMLRTVG